MEDLVKRLDFRAIPTLVGRRRGLRIEIRKSQEDRYPWVINLVEDTRLGDSEALPASYEWIDRPFDRYSFPALRLTAGPGVTVYFEKSSGHRVPLPETTGFSIEIARVQDVALVPPMAMEYPSIGRMRDEEYGPKQDSRYEAEIGPYYCMVNTLPDGICVRHPFCDAFMSVSVRQYSDSKDDRTDAKDRFMYYIDPDFAHDHETPLLVLLKTPNVKVEWSQAPRSSPIPMGETAPNPWAVRDWFEIYEVDQIRDIPADGTPLTNTSTWRRVEIENQQDAPYKFLLQATVDMALSQIPVVGNVVDLCEFVYGMTTGKDKWGNVLSDTEKALLGVSVVLPFMKPMGNKVTQLFRSKFGDRGLKAIDTIESLNRARPTNNEIHDIEVGAKLVKEGKKATSVSVDALRACVERAENSFPAASTLLRPDGGAFFDPTLNRAFTKYASTRERANPLEWIRVTQQPQAKRILELVLGKDFRKAPTLSSSVRFNPLALPIPPTLTAERAAKAAEQFQRDSFTLTKKVFKADQLGEKIALSSYISEASLGQLKGNMGEILSLRKQLEVLADLERAHPDRTFKLVNGAQLRNGKHVGEFGDNVIIEQIGKNANVHAAFEVKGGMASARGVNKQIYETMEDRIVDGTELLFPKGHRVFDRKGGRWVVQNHEVAFSYKNANEKLGGVYGLLTAKRYIIVAKGLSQLGLNSPDRISKAIKPLFLDYTSAEIDGLMALYFGAQLRRP